MHAADVHHKRFDRSAAIAYAHAMRTRPSSRRVEESIADSQSVRFLAVSARVLDAY
jgi:hypothetical protein